MKQIAAVVLCASAVAPVWAAAPVGSTSTATAKTQGSATAATAAAPKHTWELLLMPRDWPVSNPPQFEPQAWPLLKKQALKPALVLRPEDVESYIWSVQRITLKSDATKRMLAVHPDTGFEQWWIPHYPFAVRVDGEFLYGGVFDGPMSQMTMDFPVIHGEIVDGRAVLHLLPRQESFRFDPRFEESIGADDGSLLAEFMAETEPMVQSWGDEETDDPVRDKFRPILRDPRIRAVFEPLGVLVEAPPPPPDESVLYAANRAVDAARASRQGERQARMLADDYHLFFPMGYDLGFRDYMPMDKKEALAYFDDGWKPRQYAVLAVEPKIAGDDGIVYTLFYVRGKIDGDDDTKAILARRRYRRDGTGWRLVLEMHHKCFGGDPPESWSIGADGKLDEEAAIPLLEGPCWPPPWNEKEPPIPPPVELVQ
jgi:hypothetical protein